MKRIWYYGLIVVGFLMTFQISFFSFADETIPTAVTDAAQQGIKIFFKSPRATDFEQFGFSSREEANSATLGKGFRVYTVPPESILKEGVSQDLDVMAVPSNLWRFIILADGKAKVLLDVDLMIGRWTPVSIGGVGLAKELEKVLEAWPVSAGYQHKFLRIYQAKSDLMGIFYGGKNIGFLPFSSGRMGMGLKGLSFDPLDLYNSEDVLSKIRPLVKQNIQ